MPVKIAAIINACCDKDQTQRVLIQNAATEYSIDCEIFYCDPSDLEAKIEECIPKKYEALLIGGGDGSISTAVQKLIPHHLPLAVYPMGTFNHFAKALNLSTDINEIMQAIAEKKIKKIDVGQINQLYFINNVSIGLYPLLVKVREKYEDLFSRNKIAKMLITLLNFWNPLPFYHLEMYIKGKKLQRKTFLVFIGNNYYNIDFFNFGSRESLTEGELSVYIINCKSRFQLLKLLWKILTRKFVRENYLELSLAKDLMINSRRKTLEVALDGEVFNLKTPLVFKINKSFFPIITQN